MFKRRPAVRLPLSCRPFLPAPKARRAGRVLRLCCLATLPLAAFLPPASAADPDAGRVGAETCGMCHEEIYESVRATPHGKLAPERFCENCHGPGGEHADDDGNPEKIRRVPDCASCHASDFPRHSWSRSDHRRAGLDCTDCHAVHGEARAEPLLREKAPDLCLGCHLTVAAEFSMPETHPLGRGSAGCVDCHNPHAPAPRTALGGFKQQACLQCHSEYRGPWFFEHEVVAVEGCNACHAPHGSANRRLLTYPRVSDLCLQCHPGQPFFHDVTDTDGNRTTQINDCTSCHNAIHGSNNNALFLD